MTAEDVQTVIVLGGWDFLFAVISVLGITAGVLAALYRLALAGRAFRDRRRAARQSAADLATCWAIHALGTTTRQEPK